MNILKKIDYKGFVFNGLVAYVSVQTNVYDCETFVSEFRKSKICSHL